MVSLPVAGHPSLPTEDTMRLPHLPLVFLPLSAASSSPWTWICDPSSTFCSRQLYTEGMQRQGEGECRVSCAPTSLLWPLPTSYTISPGHTASFSPFDINTELVAATNEVKAMLTSEVDRQLSYLKEQGSSPKEYKHMLLRVLVSKDVLQPGNNVSEQYSLMLKETEGQLEANIEADTYFGARHGLETLFQLAVWDSASSHYFIASDVMIHDKPYFPHRGVMLDTARNFVAVPDILKLLDSLSFSKQNVFHWHITDTQSFPLHLPSLPKFAAYGAYNEDQVYTAAQVELIVEYARARGVQVIPELDAPAHVGAGWQAVDPSLTVCVNREPWTEWCVEPPCGQLNPAIPELYPVLETIYRDWMQMFQPTTFHVGGDEVHLGCWNSTPSIREWLEQHGKGDKEADFMFLWEHFLTQSSLSLASASRSAGLTSPSLVVWNNQLTHPEHIHHMDRNKYTIQLWTDASNLEDLTIKTVAEAGFKMIFSNWDATYLDCGFGGWVGNGHNWCSPYKQWQVQHQNDPLAILEKQNVSNLERAKANVLGGEVALWTEQADGLSMMTRIEPRASAYGERLWRGPLTGDWVEAERRLVIHRDRIARRGISADSLTHGWCRQNEGKCILEQNMDSGLPIY